MKSEQTNHEPKFDTQTIAMILGCIAGFLFLLGFIGFGVNDYLLSTKQYWLGITSGFAMALGLVGMIYGTVIFAGTLK